MDKISEGKNEKLNWTFFKGKKSEDFSNSKKATKIVASFRAKIDLLLVDSRLRGNDRKNRICTDGLLTDQKTTICMKTADCIPAIVWWEDSNWSGLLHLHFRGLFLGLINNFSKLMIEQNLSPEKCHTILGPSICPKCYDHKTLKRRIKWQLLHQKFPGFTHKNHGKYIFNLSGAYISELERIGIKRKNIETLNEQFCTNCKLNISRHHKVTDMTLLTVLEKK